MNEKEGPCNRFCSLSITPIQRLSQNARCVEFAIILQCILVHPEGQWCIEGQFIRAVQILRPLFRIPFNLSVPSRLSTTCVRRRDIFLENPRGKDAYIFSKSREPLVWKGAREGSREREPLPVYILMRATRLMRIWIRNESRTVFGGQATRMVNGARPASRCVVYYVYDRGVNIGEYNNCQNNRGAEQ